MVLYDAFISYSHTQDKPIASALQTVIQKLGKPWYKRRALRIFRDDTSLSATPHLWPSIELALSQSRYLILLASPEAAASHWVGKEVEYWLGYKSIDTLLIALTAGELTWHHSCDFNWISETPLPEVLKGKFPHEPKWVDLRSYRNETKTNDEHFTDLSADLASTIQGMPKEDLLSKELLQQRRMLTLAWSAAAIMLLFACLAVWFGYQARIERDIAREQRDAAEMASSVASKERDRADDALSAALYAANDIVNSIAIDLSKTPGIQPEIIHDILKRALKLQDDLPEVTFSQFDHKKYRAMTLNAAAKALLNIGDTHGALEAVEKSHAIWKDLVWQKPGDRELQSELAGNFDGIGDVKFRAGDREGAQTAYESAIPILRKLARDKNDIAARRQLALGLFRYGAMKLQNEKQSDSQATFEEAIGIYCELVKDKGQPVLRQELDTMLNAANGLPGHMKCLEDVSSPHQ